MHSSEMDAIVRGVAAAVGEQMAALLKRIADLESRVVVPAEKGDQGRGIADVLQDADGNLVLTFTDGTTKNVGKVRGSDGQSPQIDVSALLKRIDDLEKAEAKRRSDEAEFSKQLGALIDTAEANLKAFNKEMAESRHTTDEALTAAEKRLAAAVERSGQVSIDARGVQASIGEQIAAALAVEMPKWQAATIVQVKEQIKPIDGRDGRDGQPGRDGVSGKDGANGADGKDGSPGLNGKDGLGWDDLIVEHDGERDFKIVSIRGDQRKDHGTFRVPATIYRGVFQDGRGYLKNDRVTWAGSEWHANEDTSIKPGDGSKAWTLAVKKGRDGRDGDKGAAGERGPQGLPGRDRT